MTSARAVTINPHPQVNPPACAEDIQEWLLEVIGDYLDLSPEEIDPERKVTEYGLDSLDAGNTVGDLESWLKLKLQDNILFEYPTINGLSRYLAEMLALPAQRQT